MMKKMKRAPVEASPSYMVDEDAKIRLKHQNLMQDFNELLKETEATQRNLQIAKQKKLNLLAEVRFLRRRYKYLLKNPSQKFPSEHPVQPQKSIVRSKNTTKERNYQNPIIRSEHTTKERNYREKEASSRSPSAVLDLNQVSVPSGEEGTEEFQVAWEPLTMDKKSKRCSMEGETAECDLNLPICRDNGSNRAGKRKISWQDQVSPDSYVVIKQCRGRAIKGLTVNWNSMECFTLLQGTSSSTSFHTFREGNADVFANEAIRSRS